MIARTKAGVTVGQLVRCCGLGEATVKRATVGWRDASIDPFSSVPKGSGDAYLCVVTCVGLRDCACICAICC